MENEIWKDIEGYEGLYQVSSYGRVRSIDRFVMNNSIIKRLSGKILSPIIIAGYMYVHLSKNGKKKHYRIHRLVADSFIPNPDNLPFINHKDCNPLNNSVDNIEWCDAQYNNNYSDRNDKIVKTRSGRPLKIRVIQTSLTGKVIKEWASVKEISDNTGYCYGYLLQAVSGKVPSAYGYKWIKVC